MNTDKNRTSGCKAFERKLPLSVFICVYLWLIALPVPAAQPLGRLFFTAEERATLDAARIKKTRVNLETETAAEKPPAPPAAPEPEVVTYGGLVRRSDGKATVWLNNRAIHEKEVRSGATIVGKVRPDGSVTLRSPQSGRSVDLRVGQSAELLSGTIEESYARRAAVPPKSDTKPAPKPGAEANTGDSASAERAREEREHLRELEDATRALQDAAAKIGTPPPAPPPPAPLHTGPTPARPPQQPSR